MNKKDNGRCRRGLVVRLSRVGRLRRPATNEVYVPH